MPIYSFKDSETGQTTERFYPLADMPNIGDTIEESGRKFVRILDRPHVAVSKDHCFVARSLNRWDPDAPRHNEHGQPVFQSKKEVKEYVASQEGDMTYGEISDGSCIGG
jgi:hypothetical protein